MLLYIIRHAWAGTRDESVWPDDGLRPLTPDGKKRFDRMLKKLVKRGFAPAVIATSPLVRCRETAELIAARVPGKPEIVDRAELVPDANLAEIVQWTVSQPEGQEVAWVGHAPDVNEFAVALIGGPAGIDFAKGAVAAICFEEAIAPGKGQLRWLVNAKLLGVGK